MDNMRATAESGERPSSLGQIAHHERALAADIEHARKQAGDILLQAREDAAASIEAARAATEAESERQRAEAAALRDKKREEILKKAQSEARSACDTARNRLDDAAQALVALALPSEAGREAS